MSAVGSTVRSGVVLGLCLPLLAASAPGVVSGADPVETTSAVEGTEPSPSELYDQGRRAYRLGDFETAVAKWERAFESSERALLLYNISLAYKGLYGISRELADLRRARAVMDNFIKLAQADPEVELEDAEERLAALDEEIAGEEARLADASTPDPPPGDGSEPEVDEGPRRRLRWAGIGLMATGGALVLASAGFATFYVLKFQQYDQQETDYLEDFEDMECDLEPPGRECPQTIENLTTAQTNRDRARTQGWITAGVTGGVGIVALVTGAVLFTRGETRGRSKDLGWGRHRLRVSGTARSVWLSGKF